MPIRYVGLHAQQSVLYLAHGLICRHRKDINGKHHAAAHLRKLCHKAVLDIAGVVLKIKDPGKSLSEHQVIAVFFDTVRADIILKIMSELGRASDIKGIGVFLAGAVEIMKCTQAVICAHRYALSTQGCVMGHQVHLHAGKVGSCLFHVFLSDSDRHILLLQDSVGVHSFVQNHLVILIAVHIQAICLRLHQHRFLEV